VDKKTFAVEMQVHHKSLSGITAIASFFLKPDSMIIEESPFLKSLQVETWKSEKNF